MSGSQDAERTLLERVAYGAGSADADREAAIAALRDHGRGVEQPIDDAIGDGTFETTNEEPPAVVDSAPPVKVGRLLVASAVLALLILGALVLELARPGSSLAVFDRPQVDSDIPTNLGPLEIPDTSSFRFLSDRGEYRLYGLLLSGEHAAPFQRAGAELSVCLVAIGGQYPALHCMPLPEFERSGIRFGTSEGLVSNEFSWGPTGLPRVISQTSEPPQPALDIFRRGQADLDILGAEVLQLTGDETETLRLVGRNGPLTAYAWRPAPSEVCFAVHDTASTFAVPPQACSSDETFEVDGLSVIATTGDRSFEVRWGPQPGLRFSSAD